MTDEPMVWHYGLMAERWAEFITDAREIPFFLQKIEQYGQPVLDVACGTGRVCCHYYEQGLTLMVMIFPKICCSIVKARQPMKA
jgi:hypothetical protein